MPLYWLVYRLNNQISVVIEPGASLIHASILPPAKRIELVTKVICAPGIGGAAWKKHVPSRLHTNVHERGLNLKSVSVNPERTLNASKWHSAVSRTSCAAVSIF